MSLVVHGAKTNKVFFCSSIYIKEGRKVFFTVQLVLIEVKVVSGTRVNLIMVDAWSQFL